MIQHTILLAVCFILFGCKQSSNKDDETNSPVKTSEIEHTISKSNTNTQDTSNQYIYDFMKVVIADQQLDLSFGVKIEPDQGCDVSQDDKTFLRLLLIEKTKPQNVTEDWKNMSVTVNQLPKFLRKADIDEMLSQKEKLSDFKWNISRLGFNKSNNKNWYSFSRPLFSKDRKKAVMMIRNLCPGLCGSGSTVVFSQQNNKWTSQNIGLWMH